MFKSMFFNQFVSLAARHALTAGGVVLVNEGYTDAATWEMVSGGAMAAVGIGLSVGQKKSAGLFAR